jgi:hypothetical protein
MVRWFTNSSTLDGMADSYRTDNVLCSQWKQQSAGMVLHILGIQALCDIDNTNPGLGITITATLGVQSDAVQDVLEQARRGDLYFLFNGRDQCFAHHKFGNPPSNHPYVELSCSIPSSRLEEGSPMRLSLMVISTTTEPARLVEDWEMKPWKQGNGWGLDFRTLASHGKYACGSAGIRRLTCIATSSDFSGEYYQLLCVLFTLER